MKNIDTITNAAKLHLLCRHPPDSWDEEDLIEFIRGELQTYYNQGWYDGYIDRKADIK